MAIQGNLSIWTAEPGPALLAETIAHVVDRQVRDLGDREALVYRYPEEGIDLRLTYRDLQARMDAVARGLMAIGVGAGDKVAVLAINYPEWIFLELALARIGAVLVTVNTNYRRDELAYLLAQADVHTIVLMPAHRGNPYAATLRDLVPELDQVRDPARDVITSGRFPALRRAVLLRGAATAGMLSYDDMVALGASIPQATLAARFAGVDHRAPSQIQFTSGTTGAPKGAMVTHHGTVNNANIFAERAGFGAGDRFVSAMPLFHTAGDVLEVMGVLIRGATLVKALQFEPRKMLELIHHERATVFFGAPAMMIAMLADPDFVAGRFDTSRLRILITGGTPIPVPLMERMKREMGCDPVIGFGMTEASPMVTGTLATDSFELRSATVGPPLPHTEVKIVDRDGAIVPVDQPGELCIRGYLVMQGYYRMPERTAETIDPDGWLHSGDLATLASTGHLRIVGRIKDMYIRGGENVYPTEVENFLMRHPDIRQAQVVGVPDARMGEEGAAFIQVAEGRTLDAGAVEAYCRANIGRHKLPKYIRFVDDFPVTPSGKVKKYELRARLLAELQRG